MVNLMKFFRMHLWSEGFFIGFLSFFLEIETARAEGARSQPTFLESLFPFLIIFVIFYFLVIRPQAKKAKSHATFIGNLKKGDQVVTASGILGTIEGVTQNFVDVSIAEDVRVKMLKSQISNYTKEVS